MPKVKLAWRFRKGSESDPILSHPCGCKYYCYTGQIVRHCKEHMPIIKEEINNDPPTDKG